MKQSGQHAGPGKRPYRKPTVTSERVEETVLAARCRKTPTTPGPTCQAAKRFYG